MNITTKYNIWDTVWTVKDNKAYSFEVKNIIITENNTILYCDKEREISFERRIKWDTRKYRESQIVWFREELINLL